MRKNIMNFKQTEIGLIPEDWEVVRLGDVAKKLKAGGTPRTTVKEYWNGNIPFVKIGDITATQKYLKQTKTTITEAGLKNSSAWLIPKNSILLSMYASIGEVAINKILLSTNQAILAIIPQKGFDVEFGFYCLKHYGKTLYSFIVQTTQKNVNKGIAENLLIPLPPLLEQQKIARVLSRIQQTIEQQDKIIDATKNLKKSLMQRVFTEGVIKGFMFDTNIFNHILDSKIKFEDFPEKFDFFITHIQEDELGKTQDLDRKELLLKIFKKINQENIPTESAVWDISKWDMAKFGDENSLYEKIKSDLDKKEQRQNNIHDALIAETTIKNGLILVTDDSDLLEVTQKYKGEVITLKGFLSGNYRKLKETEIGLIPKSWEVVRLGESGNLQYGYTTSAQEQDTGMKFLRITDIKENGYIDWFGVPYCEIDEKNFKKYQLRNGDVLLARIGATTGKTCFIDNPPKSVFASYLIRFIPKMEEINTKFIYYYTQTAIYWLQVNANKEGKLKKGLSASVLKNFSIPLPTFPEQKQIAYILSIVDKKIELEESIKSIIKKLFKTMLYKLMTGEIRLKDIEV